MSTYSDQDANYQQAVETYGSSLQRLARAAEADRQRQFDLLQEIHVSLWRSFARFDAHCSLGTWVYRVAHNATATYVQREKRQVAKPMELDEIEGIADSQSLLELVEKDDALEQLMAWIRRLKPIDRQVITLYLEELDARDIADITGITPGAVATRISRLKLKLSKDFEEANHD